MPERQTPFWFLNMDVISQVERLIFSRFPHQPTDGQREACRAIVNFLYAPDPKSAFILKGYAGTGKTSLVSSLIRVAPQLRLKTQLLAPTGRAAKVLANYAESKAYTIHKKIYMTVIDSYGVMHMARALNKHSYTLFIVDEASMIGGEDVSEVGGHRSLLEDLIDYVQDGHHCRLMLIGDSAQLPPVGSNESPALDEACLSAISDLSITQYELTEVVRQREESGILHNATLLRRQVASLDSYSSPHLPFFDLRGMPDVRRLDGIDLWDAMNNAFGLQDLENVAVVTRSNKRANLFNQSIRNRILFREGEINAGDFVMVVKNNYYWMDKDSEISFIANGDIAEVLSVRNYQALYGFHFVDATLRFVDYPDQPAFDCKLILETLHSESPSLTKEEYHQLYVAVMEDYAELPTKADRLRELQKNPYFNALQVKFSYALTCHKTQGGQWKTIFIDPGFIVDDMIDKDLLRWLYTAITRATDQVYLINFDDKFFTSEKEDEG